MQTQGKVVYEKPRMEVITDSTVILGYLYTAYKEEKSQTLQKDESSDHVLIQFIKILYNSCTDIEFTIIFNRIMDILKAADSRGEFVGKAKELLGQKP